MTYCTKINFVPVAYIHEHWYVNHIWTAEIPVEGLGSQNYEEGLVAEYVLVQEASF